MTKKTTPSIINPANALTFTRILILPLVIYSFKEHLIITGIIAATYSGVVDLIDGSVARFFNCASKFGEFLDAVSDALLFLAGSVGAAYYGYVDTIYVVIFLGVGIINALGRVIFIKRTGAVTNFRSYASETLGGISFWLIVAAFVDFYIDIAYISTTIFAIVVVIHDYYRILTWPLPQNIKGETHA